jgi:16S rRNA U516 pseudouridylate synthase RsuA-like enzyme
MASMKRLRLGGLTLGKLQPGGFREVAPEELKAAFPGAPV